MNLKEFGWEKEVPFKIKCNNNKQDDIYIHMSWTVVKQYFLTGSSDPSWATKQQFWSQLSGSGDTETFSFNSEEDAWEKAVELQNEDSSGRRYKAVKL
jgi:hypothetical protein